MSIQFTESKAGKRYDAQVGHLFVGAEDNGEGTFNWWVAVNVQGVCPGEHGILAQGSADSWLNARIRIVKTVVELAENILRTCSCRGDVKFWGKS